MMHTGMYGPNWTQGVLAEHVTEPVTVREDGEVVVFVFAEGAFFPVLCGELVEIRTEDGVIVGRCGAPVHGVDGFACEGHTLQLDAARSEAELIAWEREIERERG